jgi:integrase
MVRVLDIARQASSRDRAILTLMAYTALRTVEVHRADLADLRTETGKLVLAVQGKGRRSKDEIVVIDNPEAVEALYTWLAQRGDAPGPLFTSMSDRNRAGRLSLSAIRTIVKGMFKQAGIVDESKTTHSLRHTAITNAIANHASVTSVREMARHKNVETTMIYFHERDRIANAAEGYIQYRKAGE